MVLLVPVQARPGLSVLGCLAVLLVAAFGVPAQPQYNLWHYSAVLSSLVNQLFDGPTWCKWRELWMLHCLYILYTHFIVAWLGLVVWHTAFVCVKFLYTRWCCACVSATTAGRVVLLFITSPTLTDLQRC